MVLANAQPSPEAVALVQAVIRAERECVVEEEQNGFTTPSHWALIGKLDATTEALFAYVVGLEADRERLNHFESTVTIRRENAVHSGWNLDGFHDEEEGWVSENTERWYPTLREAIDADVASETPDLHRCPRCQESHPEEAACPNCGRAR